jgi:hypothetical protein
LLLAEQHKSTAPHYTRVGGVVLILEFGPMSEIAFSEVLGVFQLIGAFHNKDPKHLSGRSEELKTMVERSERRHTASILSGNSVILCIDCLTEIQHRQMV